MSITAIANDRCHRLDFKTTAVLFAREGGILFSQRGSPSIAFASSFSPSPPNHSIPTRTRNDIRFCVIFFSVLVRSLFFFASSYQAAVSADNTH